MSWTKEGNPLPRERRRVRRAKRREKAACKRMDTLFYWRWRGGERCLVIPPEVLRAYLRPGRHERMRAERREALKR